MLGNLPEGPSCWSAILDSWPWSADSWTRSADSWPRSADSWTWSAMLDSWPWSADSDCWSADLSALLESAADSWAPSVDSCCLAALAASSAALAAAAASSAIFFSWAAFSYENKIILSTMNLIFNKLYRPALKINVEISYAFIFNCLLSIYQYLSTNLWSNHSPSWKSRGTYRSLFVYPTVHISVYIFNCLCVYLVIMSIYLCTNLRSNHSPSWKAIRTHRSLFFDIIFLPIRIIIFLPISPSKKQGQW